MSILTTIAAKNILIAKKIQNWDFSLKIFKNRQLTKKITLGKVITLRNLYRNMNFNCK